MNKKNNLSDYFNKYNLGVFATVDVQNSIIDSSFIRIDVDETIANSLLSREEVLMRQNEINLEHNPFDFSLRDDAVRMAWRYEYENVKLGGDGITRLWSDSQKEELLQTGHINGMEGHHIYDVSTYPQYQADPNNITFLTHKEHLNVHNGDYHNSTSGSMIDKHDNLGNIHSDGLAMLDLGFYAIALGLIPFSIELLVRLYKNNLSSQDLQAMYLNGSRIAVNAGVVMVGAGALDSMVDFIDYVPALFIVASLFRFSTASYNGNTLGQSTLFAAKGFGMSMGILGIKGLLGISSTTFFIGFIFVYGLYKFLTIDNKDRDYITSFSKPIFI